MSELRLKATASTKTTVVPETANSQILLVLAEAAKSKLLLRRVSLRLPDPRTNLRALQTNLRALIHQRQLRTN